MVHSMFRRVALLTVCAVALEVRLAASNAIGWCKTGLHVPDFAEGSTVDIIVGQAPLFSNNPKIGGKFGWFGLYHTSIIMRQDERYWTLEFDAVQNVLNASLPSTIVGDHLVWDNDARFCLTEGILWGRKHWSKTFSEVAKLTPVQARLLFTDFMPPVNTSVHLAKPVYQLFAVEHADRTLVSDITCADGARWFLHYIVAKLKVPLAPDFQFSETRIVVNARSVVPVDTNDPEEWGAVVDMYKNVKIMFDGKQSFWARLKAAWHSFPCKFVYDGNSQTYFKIVGNGFPYLRSSYVPVSLTGPPWLARAPGSEFIEDAYV